MKNNCREDKSDRMVVEGFKGSLVRLGSMHWLCYTSSHVLRQSCHSIGTAGLYLYWEDPSPSDVCDASGRPSRCFSLCQGGASRTAKSVLFIQLGPRTYQSPGHMVWASLGTAEGPWQCPNRGFQQQSSHSIGTVGPYL